VEGRAGTNFGHWCLEVHLCWFDLPSALLGTVLYLGGCMIASRSIKYHIRGPQQGRHSQGAGDCAVALV